ncbi:MAG: hypothetical protein ACE5DM_05890 [Candidatus Nanoarchaeia archaeon]
MAFGDKLKFWKKDEDFSDLGDFGLGDFGGGDKAGNPADAGDPFGQQAAQTSGTQPSMGGPGMGSAPTEHQMEQPAPMSAQPGMGIQQPMQPDVGMAQSTFPSTAERMGAPMVQAPQQTTPYPSAPVSPPTPKYHEVHPEQYQQNTVAKDIEIISAKLDSLRATLESINQRLANLERMAQGEKRRYDW